MASDFLRVGDVLYGFCGGWFGRDSWTDKRVEAIGSDWVVAREMRDDYRRDGDFDPDQWPTVQFYHGSPEALCEYRTPED